MINLLITALYFRKFSSLLFISILCGMSATVAHAELTASPVYIECSINDETGSSNNKAKINRGSGVLVWIESADSTRKISILTAKHVGQRGANCVASLNEGAVPNISILRSSILSSHLDALVFEFVGNYQPEGKTPARFLLPKRGMNVSAWGVPSNSAGNQFEVRTGSISSNTPDENGFLSSDVLTAAGMSGGPVFERESGALIGIVAGVQFDNLGLATSYKVLSVEAIANDFNLIPYTSPRKRPLDSTIASTADAIAEGWLNFRKSSTTKIGPDGHCGSDCESWPGVAWELNTGSDALAVNERISSVECICLSGSLCWFDESGPRGGHQSIVASDGRSASCFISARTHPTRWTLTANVQKLGQIRGWVYLGKYKRNTWDETQFAELANLRLPELEGKVLTSLGSNIREASSEASDILTQAPSGSSMRLAQTSIDPSGFVWGRIDLIDPEIVVKQAGR